MSRALRLLLVDDSASDAKLVASELRRTWPDLIHERVDDAAALRSALAHGGWDAVLCDWSMPKLGAMRALDVIREMQIDLPFILVSGTIGEESAVEAMRAGAHDYVLKDKLTRLAPALEREMRDHAVREARRRSDEALRVQEGRFRALIEKSQDGIFLTDKTGLVLYLSPAGRTILGVDPDAGKLKIAHLWHPDDRPRVADLRGQLFAGPGASVLAELRVLRPDGAVRLIELTATNLLEHPGLEAVVGNFRDVTERKASLDALRESEARFRALANSGVVGVSITAHSGEFVEANDAFLAMVGYTREDLAQGKVRWTEMTPPELRPHNVAVIEQIRLHGFATPWEKEYICKDGSRVPCLVAVSMLDAERNIALAIDLTERKRVEAALEASEGQLRQAQKMEAVGRLAGGVAHDFNNMLSVILSYASLVRDTLPAEDPSRDDLEEVTRAGQRAADLTRQLLLFSRQQVLETKVLDVNALLANMHKMMRRLVGEDVEVVSAPAPALGRVRADPGSLEQVIMNLVVNARDAMPRGGTLTMATENVVLDEEYARTHHGVKPGPHVLLSVSDTGVGMDEATQARIFEPFFTTKEVGKGTGLGLSTVFGIVQQSGGTIWVESELGKGATFEVYLPRVDDEIGRETPTIEPSTLRGTETILLVEDEDQLRLVARGILRRCGYQVIEARNGGEALLVCEQHPGGIQLLLSDVVMPKMSGPELAMRLMRVRPEMRVLCMSGYTDDSVARQSVLEAQFAFLQKPFTPQSLSRKVREVLDGAPPRAIR